MNHEAREKDPEVGEELVERRLWVDSDVRETTVGGMSVFRVCCIHRQRARSVVIKTAQWTTTAQPKRTGE